MRKITRVNRDGDAHIGKSLKEKVIDIDILNVMDEFPKKKCYGCGKLFTPSQINNLYCSNRCRVNYNGRKLRSIKKDLKNDIFDNIVKDSGKIKEMMGM